MNMRKVGVVGCGRMGSGLVEVSALAGFDVVCVKLSANGTPATALANLADSLARGVAKGMHPRESMDRALERVRFTTDLASVSDADIVLECAVESLPSKRRLLADLERATAKKGAVLATNTSSLELGELARALNDPGRFLGLHFFSPVTHMKLCEVGRAATTSDATLEASLRFVSCLGKTPIVLGDAPGYLVNRLLVPQICQAIDMLEQGVGGAKDIDTAMKLGCGHPMGPLALADFIGLDVVFAMAQSLAASLGDRRFRAPHLLRRLVLAGHHGKKTRLGIYDYRSGEPFENPDVAAAVHRQPTITAAAAE
jgi:3-hydroxybutyryl-CoA dehydrogenase